MNAVCMENVILDTYKMLSPVSHKNPVHEDDGDYLLLTKTNCLPLFIISSFTSVNQNILSLYLKLKKAFIRNLHELKVMVFLLIRVMVFNATFKKCYWLMKQEYQEKTIELT